MCILLLFCFSIISRIESLAWTGLSPNFETAIRPFYFDTNSAAELIARNKHAARRNGRNGNGGASLPAASRDTILRIAAPFKRNVRQDEMSDEHACLLLDIIKKKPDLFLDELVDELEKQCGIQYHQLQVYRKLKKRGQS